MSQGAIDKPERTGSGAASTVPGLWIATAALSLVVALGFIARLALNEYTEAGAIVTFVVMTSWLCLLMALSRRPILVSLLAAGLAAGLIAINAAKHRYLGEMFHPIDVYLLGAWILGDPSFLLAYANLFLPAFLAIAVGLLAVYLTVRLERSALHRLRWPRPPLALVAILAVLAVGSTGMFLRGSYMRSIHGISYYTQLAVNSGIRLSYMVAAFRDLRQIKSGLDATGAEVSGLDAPRLPPVACTDCPDLIVYHVESVFDPNKMQPYASHPPIWTQMGGQMHGRQGYLRTNVFGGRSMISEFELLCGVHHGVFDAAGNYPNLFMQPFVRRCGPALLRRAGYETIALYSTPASMNHAGNMFSAYGFEDFRDSKRLGMPSAWHLMRDKFMVDEALRILAEPRRRPRLILISTMYNHGPHSESRIVERYPGPYDIDLARDGAVKDYVNRLNDTLDQLRRLDREVAKLPHKAAVLYYGDHQPNIPADFAQWARDLFGGALRYMTFYRFSTNWPVGETGTGPDLRIEHLLSGFLDHVGLRAVNDLNAVTRFVDARCGGDQTRCDESQRRALRAFAQR